MHIEQFGPLIGRRDQTEFPLLPCQARFFHKFNQAPERITYDDLMRKNFENTAAPFRGYFDDVMRECGTDILAYYRSFHETSDWGIYILDAGVDYLAEELLRLSRIHLPGRNNLVLSRLDTEYLAKHNLLLHELGHHAVEIVHTVLELHPDNPIRDSYISTHSAGNYNPYTEEAVCNWNVKKKKNNFKIRAFSRFDAVKDFMVTQPVGYNRFEEIRKQNLIQNIFAHHEFLRRRYDPQTDTHLKNEFEQHSKLSRVKPGSVRGRNNPIGFEVPIYIIPTGNRR